MRWFAETGRRLRGGIGLVYLAVLVAAPIMDAAIEAITFEQTTHVESQTDQPCYAGHDEVMCQLCRLIDVPGLSIARVRFALAPGEQHRTTYTPAPGHPATACLEAHPSRAPPIA